MNSYHDRPGEDSDSEGDVMTHRRDATIHAFGSLRHISASASTASIAPMAANPPVHPPSSLRGRSNAKTPTGTPYDLSAVANLAAAMNKRVAPSSTVQESLSPLNRRRSVSVQRDELDGASEAASQTQPSQLECELPVRELARQMSKRNGQLSPKKPPKTPGKANKKIPSIHLLPWRGSHHKHSASSASSAHSKASVHHRPSVPGTGPSTAQGVGYLDKLENGAVRIVSNISETPPLTCSQTRQDNLIAVEDNHDLKVDEKINDELMIGEVKKIKIREEVALGRNAVIGVILALVASLLLRHFYGRVSQEVNVLQVVSFASSLLLSYPVIRFAIRFLAYLMTTRGSAVLYRVNAVYFAVVLHNDIAMTLWATAAVHIWWQLYYDWIYSEDSANSRSIFRVGFNLLQCLLAFQVGVLAKNFLVLIVATIYLWKPYLSRVQSSILAQYILLLLTDYCYKGYCNPDDENFALEMRWQGISDKNNVSLYAISKAMGFLPRNKLSNFFYREIGGNETLNSSKDANKLGNFLFYKLLARSNPSLVVPLSEKEGGGDSSKSIGSGHAAGTGFRNLLVGGIFGNTLRQRSDDHSVTTPRATISDIFGWANVVEGAKSAGASVGDLGKTRSLSDSSEEKRTGEDLLKGEAIIWDEAKEAEGMAAPAKAPGLEKEEASEARGESEAGESEKGKDDVLNGILEIQLNRGNFCPGLHKDLLEVAFKIFDLDKSGTVSRKEMVEGVVGTFKDHRSLALTLQDSDHIARKLGLIIMGVILFILVFVWLSIWGTDVMSLSVTFASFLIAFSFMIGTSASNLMSSVIFIFVSRLYDVGDRVHIFNDAQTMSKPTDLVVVKVNLMTTVFRRWDEQIFYMPNHLLASKTIVNIQRAADQWHEFFIQIAADTPSYKIKSLQASLQAFTKSKDKPEGMYPRIGFSLTGIEDSTKLSIRITFRQRGNWQRMEKKWMCQSMCTWAIKNACDSLKISYALPQVPVTMKEKET